MQRSPSTLAHRPAAGLAGRAALCDLVHPQRGRAASSPGSGRARRSAAPCSKKLSARAGWLPTLGKRAACTGTAKKTAAHGIYDDAGGGHHRGGGHLTGYFLARVTDGLPVERILELASKASSLAVSRRGAADSIPARAEVEACALVPSGVRAAMKKEKASKRGFQQASFPLKASARWPVC